MESVTRMRKLNHGNLNTSFYLGWQERVLLNARGMQRERESEREASDYTVEFTISLSITLKHINCKTCDLSPLYASV